MLHESLPSRDIRKLVFHISKAQHIICLRSEREISRETPAGCAAGGPFARSPWQTGKRYNYLSYDWPVCRQVKRHNIG